MSIQHSPPEPSFDKHAFTVTPSTDLHVLPPDIAPLYGKKRAVFSFWPRDPNGKPIIPNSSLRGKETPNGICNWGATLYDFYCVEPIPGVPNALAYASGSRIAAGVRQHGELDVASELLDWAEHEAEPREVPVTDTQTLIEGHEYRVHFKLYDQFSAIDEVRARATATEDDEPPSEEEGTPIDTQSVGNEDADEPSTNKTNGVDSVLMQDRPISSPFHPSHYPEPWPFIPFANPNTVPLQKQLPHHLLPETLYIHDPYDLLHVERSIYDEDDTYSDAHSDEAPSPLEWLDTQPKVLKYKLHLTPTVRAALVKARKKAEEEEQKKKRILKVYRFMPTKADRARGVPAYEVALPTKPPALTRVDEAHLYISPLAKLGSGNHSEVYKAELELPRNLFVEPTLCMRCVGEELEKEKCALKKSGKWRSLLVQKGMRIPEGESDDDTSDVDEGYEMPVPPDPNEEFDYEEIAVLQSSTECMSSDGPSSSDANDDNLVAFRIYCPGIQWQSSSDPSTICEHRRSHLDTCPVPRTATFQVAAKLSIQYDAHLAREAKNYQEFPEHFFQNWNGYNLVRPIRNPVPVNALVPQFYGYYVPHTNNNKAPGSSHRPYLSPILLLEHCGISLDPATLSLDDREECASLLLRFNHAGWLHESIAERNVVMQKIPFPALLATQNMSLPKREMSFRLIDFGRSVKEKEPSPAFYQEQQKAMRLCKLSHGVLL